MFTQVITPTENPVILNFPQELLGHEIKITATAMDEDNEERKRAWEEALAFWNSIEVDMSNFKFDREEANERFH